MVEYEQETGIYSIIGNQTCHMTKFNSIPQPSHQHRNNAVSHNLRTPIPPTGSHRGRTVAHRRLSPLRMATSRGATRSDYTRTDDVWDSTTQLPTNRICTTRSGRNARSRSHRIRSCNQPPWKPATRFGRAHK